MTPRHGAIALGMVIALVVLQLVVVTALVSGVRDHDATRSRLESSRAFYATDSAVSMALRELYRYTDEDGDGSIGGVSSDGNASNDPLFVTGRAAATIAPAGSNFSITSSGRAGNLLCRQVVTFVPNYVPSNARRVVYSDWPNDIPVSRTWDGTSWSAAAATIDVGSQQYWSVLRRCPTRYEMLATYTTHSRTLQTTMLTNNTWSPVLTFTNNLGTQDQRPHDAAYEALSGDGLVVYRIANGSTIYYRTWNGSAWSAQQTVASPVSGAPRFLRLVPKPGSDEIMLVATTTDDKVGAMIWTGATWTDSVALDTGVNAGQREVADAAYEASTGRCLVVWGKDSTTSPQYRIWSGSAWLTGGAAPSVGASPRWIRLAADPASATILMGCLDADEDINVNAWSGSAWGATTEVETAANTVNRRAFDLSFTSGGTSALLLWGATINTPRYRLWNGSSWGAQQLAPALSNHPLIVQLRPSSGTSEILALFAVNGGQSCFEFLRFNGSSFDSYQQLVSNLSGADPEEVFMISDDPGFTVNGGATRNWAQVAPQ